MTESQPALCNVCGVMGVVVTKEPEGGEREVSQFCTLLPSSRARLGLPPCQAATLGQHYYVVEHFRYSPDTFNTFYTFYKHQPTLHTNYLVI